jgi:hypothetical protein
MLSTNTLITMFNKHFHTPKHHVLSSDFVRHPIRFRPPSDQIPSATRSDSVRHPIRFRTPPDWIPYAARLDSVRCPMKLAIVVNNISYSYTQH